MKNVLSFLPLCQIRKMTTANCKKENFAQQHHRPNAIFTLQQKLFLKKENEKVSLSDVLKKPQKTKVFEMKLMEWERNVSKTFLCFGSFLNIFLDVVFRYTKEDDTEGRCDLLAYSSDPLKQSMETLADPKFNIYQKDGSCDDLNNLNLNSEMPRSRELTGKIANNPKPPYSRPQFSGFLGNSFFHVHNLKPQYSTNQKIDGGFFNTAASLLVGEGKRIP